MLSKIFKFIIGGKTVYKSVPRNPNAIREAQRQGGELVQKPSQKIISAAKPFKPVSGAGSRGVPSAAQRTERAIAASRMPKLRTTSQTQSGSGGGSKPPVRLSGPPTRASGSGRSVVVARPRTVVTPKPRPQRVAPPPKRPQRPGTFKPGAAQRMRDMVVAAIAASEAAKNAPKSKSGMSKAKASPSIKVPKPRPSVQGPPRPPKKTSPGPVGPQKKGGAQKNISAGANTGFGIKGNQFVGGPEERAIMMKYYGGTGSAAAKAALEGKQGILKSKGMAALKKELAEARKKRLASEAKRKDGGKVAPSKYKGFSKLPEKVQKKMSPKLADKYKKGGKVSKPKSEIVARQQRGWGAARKPKK